MLSPLKSGTVAVGAKQTRRALQRGTVLQVFLAQDADPAIITPLEALCQAENIPVVQVESMAQLGAACGIAVSAAVAATVKEM